MDRTKQMYQYDDYMGFQEDEYNKNKEFCQWIIKKKKQAIREIMLKRQIQQDASSILKQFNTQNNKEYQNPLFNLDNLSVDEKLLKQQLKEKQKQARTEKVQQRLQIKHLSHSLKVNGINLVLEFFPSKQILLEKTQGIISFISFCETKPKVCWPGNLIMKTYPRIKQSLVQMLRRDKFKRYFEFDAEKTDTVIFFASIKSKKDIDDSIKRMISTMRQQRYKVIHLSTCLSPAEQKETSQEFKVNEKDQIAYMISRLINQLRLIENQPAKIVLCCNQNNMRACFNVFNEKENELLLDNEIDLS